MNNVAGIDVSKGKSMVSVLRPFGEVVAKPFSIGHTGSELKERADYLKSLDGETRQNCANIHPWIRFECN